MCKKFRNPSGDFAYVTHPHIPISPGNQPQNTRFPSTKNLTTTQTSHTAQLTDPLPNPYPPKSLHSLTTMVTLPLHTSLIHPPNSLLPSQTSTTHPSFPKHLKAKLTTPPCKTSTNYKEAFSLFDKRGTGRVPLQSLGDLLRACGQNPTLAEIADLEKNVGGDCKSPLFPLHKNLLLLGGPPEKGDFTRRETCVGRKVG